MYKFKCDRTPVDLGPLIDRYKQDDSLNDNRLLGGYFAIDKANLVKPYLYYSVS